MNRHLFLKEYAGTQLPGRLRWAKNGYAKLVCPTYHRHLVNSYEAIWAVTEAIRHVTNKGALVPRRWRPAEHEVTEIVKMANRLGSFVKVDNPFFSSPEFVNKVITLEGLGLAPHYQPIREKLKSYSAEMFEVLIAELIRAHFSHEVFWSYEPAFLNGEVDVYARNSAGKRIAVLVGSCKLRISSAHTPVILSEVQNLATRIGEAGKHERRSAQQVSIPHDNVNVEGAIFTNAIAVADDAKTLAKDRGIAIFNVTIPAAWLEGPVRHRLKMKDVKSLVEGAPLSCDILWPKQD